MNERGDWELVRQAQAGDMRAFEALVRRYQEAVVHFCWRVTGSREDAEEAAQDAFVRVYNHLGRLAPRARFSTFLFGIARNLALNAVRDATRRGRGKTQPLERTPAAARGARADGQARRHEVESLIEQALGRLTPGHREVLVLREMQGLDYEAMARVLGCRKGTVKSRLARARAQLRAQIESLGGGEL